MMNKYPLVAGSINFRFLGPICLTEFFSLFQDDFAVYIFVMRIRKLLQYSLFQNLC